MIFLDMGEKKPCVGLVLDGHNTVIMAPPVVSYMLEWSRERVLAYAKYRGWEITESDEPQT